ncbi:MULTISPECIES: DUF6345 domain-containing protein [unclassified Methanoculleus]|jgi:hypothetical protein
MNGKIGAWAFFMLLVTVFVGTACVIPVSAGMGDDSDAIYPEFGVEYKQIYNTRNNLPNSPAIAEGFYEVFDNAGWGCNFYIGDWDRDTQRWDWDSDAAHVDSVDLVFWAGHGDDSFILLDGLLPVLAWVYFHDCNWGDQDLEWILLHSCHTTQIPGEFKAWPHWALNGAHLVCGFDTVGYDYAEDGAAVANKLFNNYKVRHAWYFGLDETHGNDVWIGTIGENAACGDDRIWGEGSVIADPPVDSEIYRWLFQCN